VADIVIIKESDQEMDINFGFLWIKENLK
jgi:hypothetical protein